MNAGVDAPVHRTGPDSSVTTPSGVFSSNHDGRRDS